MANDKARQKKLQKQREKKNQKRKEMKQDKRTAKGEKAKVEAVLRKMHPLKMYPYWSEGIGALAARMEAPWPIAAAYVDEAVAKGEIEEPIEAWTFVRAAVLPEDALIASLAAHGVEIDRDRFVAQTTNYRGAVRLVEGEYADLAKAPLVHDHLVAAFTALWVRWIPERASEEELWVAWGRLIGDLESDTGEIVADWETFGRRLFTTLTAEDADLDAWIAAFGIRETVFVEELMEIGIDIADGVGAGQDLTEATDLLGRLLEQFWGAKQLSDLWGEWATAMIGLGRQEEAFTRVTRQRERAPEMVGSTFAWLHLHGAWRPDADKATLEESLAVLTGLIPLVSDEDRVAVEESSKSVQERIAALG